MKLKKESDRKRGITVTGSKGGSGLESGKGEDGFTQENERAGSRKEPHRKKDSFTGGKSPRKRKVEG